MDTQWETNFKFKLTTYTLFINCFMFIGYIMYILALEVYIGCWKLTIPTILCDILNNKITKLTINLIHTLYLLYVFLCMFCIVNCCLVAIRSFFLENVIFIYSHIINTVILYISSRIYAKALNFKTIISSNITVADLGVDFGEGN